MAEGSSTEQEFLKTLLDMAQKHCSSRRFDEVDVLYRNKDGDYFERLVNNIMTPQWKDDGGDPRCPINSKLRGVFFGVTLWKSCLPDKSPYGDTRVVVPLERVFDESARLYFADFYCMSGQSDNHYVTLVLTKAKTEEDRFCRKHLVPLDEGENVFLKKKGDTYKTLNQKKLWVEVFYTHEVDISGLDLTPTGVLGRGSSSGGIPKTSGCRICCV